MENRKELLFISQDEEMALIQKMTYILKMANLDIHPSKTCFLCVSPDYSGIATQLLSHSLSMDGEIFHIEAVNVPFPDEKVDEYRIDFELNYSEWSTKWENFVLIEAGVIRGGNYSWITQSMMDIFPKKFWTVALVENVMSNYESDFVSMLYNNQTHDLHFWWEQPNNHWKW